MLRRIAVHLDLSNDCENRLRTAIELAKAHSAELTGIYAAYRLQEYLLGESVALAEGMNLMRQHQARDQETVEKLFHGLTGDAGVAASLRTVEGIPDEAVVLHARNSEVLIVSQPNSLDAGTTLLKGFVETVLLSTGRPVLVLPHAWDPAPIGKRALYCWDRGQPSARAIADAAPILREADELHVLTMDEQTKESRAEVPFEDLAAYCKAMGYPEAQPVQRLTSGVGIGETILNAVSDRGCDLVVMGAYGHSRMRQMVMGGATSSLLKAMTVPVLFSH